MSSCWWKRYPRHTKFTSLSRKAVRSEIKLLEEADFIEKVDGSQEWISNFVVVPKKNGTVRLCLDAPVINTSIKREKYAILTLNSIVDEIHGSTIFAKLDMREAYTQLELDVDSRKITNFNTYAGVYRNKRLVYGCNGEKLWKHQRRKIYQRRYNYFCPQRRRVDKYFESFI